MTNNIVDGNSAVSRITASGDACHKLCGMRFTHLQGTFSWPSAYPNCVEDSMYCNYCGKSIQDDANVCAYCGTRVGGVIARKRLVRPREGRKIAGVCLGMGEYFDLDVTLVRVVWLITAFMTGVGFLGYIIAWIVMPEEPYLLAAQVPAGGQQHVTNP